MREYEDEDVEDEETNVIIEEEDEEVVMESYNDDEPETPPPASKSLPKRVLAFSSKKLLNLFSKCSRGSVDGTLKVHVNFGNNNSSSCSNTKSIGFLLCGAGYLTNLKSLIKCSFICYLRN